MPEAENDAQREAQELERRLNADHPELVASITAAIENPNLVARRPRPAR